MATEKNTAPKFEFTLDEDITIPEGIETQTQRPNVITDNFLTPALAKVLTDEKAEPSMFFPLSYFQGISTDWAKKNNKPAKELKVGDVRQKLNDAFKKFQEKNAKATLVEMVLMNFTGKEGNPKAPEAGVRAFLRMKKK